VYSPVCGLTIRGSVAGGDKRVFFFSPQRANWLRDPPSLLHDRRQGFFRAEGEIDRSPSSISEVKKERIITSAPLYTLKVCKATPFIPVIS